MPLKDGLETTREICSKYSEDKRPKIIALTASVMQEERDKCLEAGMDDFLSKPLVVDELIHKIYILFNNT